MRRFLPVLIVALVAAACGKNPLSPTAGGNGTAAQPFVLKSAADPRLPAPMLEVTGASAADWAGLRRPARNARADRASVRAADPASFWNQITVDLATRAALPAPLFARATALTQIAIYDALIASRDPRRGQLPENTVAAGSASVVLPYLFPAAAGRINAEANAQAGFTGTHSTSGAGARAWSLGRRVGRLVVEQARSDGSRAAFRGRVPAGRERWNGTRPLLPMAGGWRCWILSSADAVHAEGPYPIGSAEDRRDLAEVVRISLGRAPEQVAGVQKWSDPPVATWNRILGERLAGHSASALGSARAYAYLNAALYDGLVASWRAKYVHWTAGPDQRHPGLVTLLPTPNAPSYTSGDASAAGAASMVLSELFPGDERSLWRLADEAAMTGLWSGIQFRHDVEQGLALGRSVGDRAVLRMRGDGPQPLFAAR